VFKIERSRRELNTLRQRAGLLRTRILSAAKHFAQRPCLARGLLAERQGLGPSEKNDAGCRMEKIFEVHNFKMGSSPVIRQMTRRIAFHSNLLISSPAFLILLLVLCLFGM
jgi:hypothetical protein